VSLRILSKSIITILGASIFALTLPGLSAAKDFCLTINSSTYVLIGKGFTVPLKGRCKPWTGLTVQSNFNSPSAGTGCTSSDGSHLNFTITTTFPDSGLFFLDTITLALPALTGTDFNVEIGSTPGSFSAVGAFCAPVPIPAVTTGSAKPADQVAGPSPR
jgi:hypothetical protein